MIDTISQFHFIRPWWLLLLPVLIGLWSIWQRRSNPLRGWREQVDADLLQAMIVGSQRQRSWHGGWLLACWCMELVAIAGPTWRLEPSPFAEDAAPLMILLKADATMDRDTPTPNALERAKLKIEDLAEIRKGQPLGLIAYSGSAHLVLPPTRDTSAVAEMAKEIHANIMPVPGDRLDRAIEKSLQLFAGESQRGTVLVVAESVRETSDLGAIKNFNARETPVQFLAMSDEHTLEAESLEQAAKELGGSVQYLTPDDTDVTAIDRTASRQSLESVSGESNRWQEAGYWLVPIVALCVALSFRRQATTVSESTK